MSIPGDQRSSYDAADESRRRTEARRRAADAGENAAASHLESLGYMVLARNLRVGRDEIDILALDPDGRTVVVVEVKCRARAQARPEERIDWTKRQHLSRAALALSTRREFTHATFRFDAISVIETDHGRQLQHWQGAFDAR